MVLACLSFLKIAQAQGLVEEGAFVLDSDKSLLTSLTVNSDLVFDHVSSEGFEVYGPTGLLSFLSKNNISYRAIEQIPERVARDYPSPEQINSKIYELQTRNPSIIKVINLGKSVLGRDILAVKISDNVNEDELEPEFKYISSMHGDEITGRELMMYLIEDIINGYGIDPRITKLVDATEIFIVPSMNPDGSAARRRGNANNYDLNRNFPDFTTPDNQDIIDMAHRQPESRAIMKFQREHNFALSANFHGGAEVMNYAWDTIPDQHPLQDLLVALSLDYASRVDYMSSSQEFPQGITNGYAWYEVNNGMQDWSYYWHNDLQFTIELSIPKWPNFSKIPYYYEKNRDALLSFIENVHLGAGVQYREMMGNKDIAADLNGTVTISKAPYDQFIGTYPFQRSQFYKVLPPGEYNFTMTYEDGSRKQFLVTAGGGYTVMESDSKR